MTIANALKHLFPNANPLRDWIVEDNGSGAAIVAWYLPDAQPTLAQLQTASAAYDAALAQAMSDALGLRTAIMAIALTAVGSGVAGLTPAQVRALLAVLLWERGALDKDGKIRPLAEWVQ